MSATVDGSNPGGAALQAEISLTAVKVAFTDKRPKNKLKLIVSLDGRGNEAEIDNGKVVQWTKVSWYLAHATNISRCMAGTKICVQVQHREHFGSWKTFASVDGVLTEKLQCIVDAENRICVMLTIIPSSQQGARLVESLQALSEMPDKLSTDEHPDISEVEGKLEDAKEHVQNQKVVTDKLGRIWDVITTAQSLGESLSDIHPAIGAAVSAVGLLIKACEKQESYRDEALELIEQLGSFISVLNYVQELTERKDLRRAFEHMLKFIAETSDYIRNKTNSTIIGNLFGNEDTQKIAQLKADFMRAKETFDRSLQLQVFSDINDIERNTQLDFILATLAEGKDPQFRSGNTDTCLEGTRTYLCQRIANWLDTTAADQPNLFWLHGKAGAGKSTVANTVRIMAQENGHPVSCFFCKRDHSSLGNPQRLFPTLAYRFSQEHKSYRTTVYELLRDGTRGAGVLDSLNVKEQFDKLFAGPITQTVDPRQPHVVIIDALDECGSWRDQRKLAQCIVALSQAAPWVKVFVTSRDEVDIHNIFSGTTRIERNINTEEGTEDDIRMYIERAAKETRNLELSEETIHELVTRAEGLFIWCSTLFKWLGESRWPKGQLDKLLSGLQQGGPWSQMYELYDKILDSSFKIPDDVSFVREVLMIINVTANYRPLSSKAIGSFLLDNDQHRGISEREMHARVADYVRQLHGVLYVDEGNASVRAHHTSFYDFLQWKAANDPGWRTQEIVHRRLFDRCMNILHAGLRFNMCKIETPALNRNIPDLTQRIATHISEELQYSSSFWFTHLRLSNLAEAEASYEISGLLCSTKLLYWLEALSLQNALRRAPLALNFCIRFFKDADIVATASDIRRFIAFFLDAMDSVSHIYISALCWLPEESLTYANLGLSKWKHRHLISNRQLGWDTVVWDRPIGKPLWSIAYSPDGRSIACSAEDNQIYILDAHTGEIERKLPRDHRNIVYSLAYSPDGQFIVSGSWDKTVAIWDTKSNHAVCARLEGHSDEVNCVAYSPDGRFVASGSDDRTVRIWDLQTKPLVGRILRHTSEVWALAYSPDGRYITSGCKDGLMYTWNTTSHLETRVPLEGDQGAIYTIAYSPDGGSIACGYNDYTILIWNAHTGETVGQPLRGHTASVRSVKYSFDGRFILSSSNDATIRMWDAATGAFIGEVLEGHSNSVKSVAYSPDGLFIASASKDGTARVWDVRSGSTVDDQLQGHPNRILTIAYSPDARHIAYGSDDKLIRVRDAQTGAAVGGPLQGHTGEILSVTYSPDGRFIASGSDDRTVRIWNAEAGSTVGKRSQGHTDWVRSVVYSPDGHLLASASDDATIRLWDAQTGSSNGQPLSVVGSKRAMSIAFSADGRLVCGYGDGTMWIWDVHSATAITKLQGHSDAVVSVAFSPDGRIASGSKDTSVRIWDLRAGMALGRALPGHKARIRQVAYSPDGRYVASSSDDGTTRIWNSQSGSAFGEPLLGHEKGASVLTVAYSPDDLFLATGGSDGRILIYDAPGKHRDLSKEKTKARWLACCSEMNKQDGWVKDGGELLLWVPPSYRSGFHTSARVVIGQHLPRAGALSVDYEKLLAYGGRNWVKIFEGLDDSPPLSL
ncbi:hypothetical protein EIP86_005770 [Pleurotus ostreatoroseus]|nr:hypothetical protein EIP86_005770 [Pleurotus ostreatoroseus]